MNSPLRTQPTTTRRSWIPYAVLLFALLLTALATYYVAAITRARDAQRFHNSVQRAQDNIVEQLETYIALLRGGAGFFAASESVSRQEFRAYVDRLNLPEQYPGIRGIGLSVRVPEHDRAEWMARMRREIHPNFTLKPDAPRPETHAIIYLEPLDRPNREAIGYDMYTDPVRREAMARARDAAKPAMSGKVTLVQEQAYPQPQPGFLIYLPVYRGGAIPPTVPERRARLFGFIYSPFRADDLLEGIFGSEPAPGIDFQVYDGAKISPDTLLHDSRKIHAGATGGASPLFARRTHLNIAGREWSLAFTTRPDFDLASNRGVVPLVLAGGALFSLALFGIMRLLSLSAMQMEEQQAHITALNERLQRAMTETHHRVKNNMQIIAAMIDMQMLDHETISREELRRLGTHIQTLAVVHDVLTEHAKSDGEAQFVAVEEILEKLLPLLQRSAGERALHYRLEEVWLSARQGTSLALVVNELVSNAIKYGGDPVEVTLTRQEADREARLEVSDNGPGFPPGFDPAAAANTGLELVQHLCRWDLSGSIQFVNRAEGGARVLVRIPLSAESPAVASGRVSSPR